LAETLFDEKLEQAIQACDALLALQHPKLLVL
jgi:hypothetical protein